MPHLHTEPGGHDLTASAYVLIDTDGTPRLWLHWHKKLNQWLQFGGHVEHTEQPWAAVVHELKEESGYTTRQLRVYQPADHIGPLTGAVVHPSNVCINTHVFPGLDHYHTDIAYALVADSLPELKPAIGESERIKAMTRSEVLQLPETDIPASVREIALYVFDVVQPNWQTAPASDFFISA